MKKENLSVLLVMSSQLNDLTPTTMLTHHEKSIYCGDGRQTQLPTT